jgi:hypothetical protein
MSLYSIQDSTIWKRSDTSSGTCAFTNNAYHVFVNEAKSSQNLTSCFPQGYSFNNFIYQVQMTTARGNGGGIIFRANPLNMKWYFFTINSDGSYYLYLYSGLRTGTILHVGSNSKVIHPEMNKFDLLSVVAQQNDIYLFVNGQFLWKLADKTYSSGDIGLLVAGSQNASDVAFESAQVWQI